MSNQPPSEKQAEFLEFMRIVRVCCQKKAIDHGFPEQAGSDIFDAMIAENVIAWSEQKFFEWFQSMQAKYSDCSLLELYEECSAILHLQAEAFSL